jgi:membrane protein DedA with SNARE-associated domain
MHLAVALLLSVVALLTGFIAGYVWGSWAGATRHACPVFDRNAVRRRPRQGDGREVKY